MIARPKRLSLKSLPPPMERHEQQTFFAWLHYLTVDGLRVREYAFAVPNGSYLHGDVAKRAIQGHALRLQGVRAGVPDVFIEIPRSPYHGLRIEFKRIGAHKPGDDQAMWHARLRSQGYFVAVCYGFAQAKAVTLEYFDVKDQAP